jgi:hypothetical protein
MVATDRARRVLIIVVFLIAGYVPGFQRRKPPDLFGAGAGVLPFFSPFGKPLLSGADAFLDAAGLGFRRGCLELGGEVVDLGAEGFGLRGVHE